MTESVIDRKKLRKTLRTSWSYTMLAFFNMIAIVSIIAAVAIRFGGPRAFLATIIPMLAISLLMFLFSENVVNIMLRSKKPDPNNDQHQRFVRLATKVSKQVGLWGKPRLYIANFKDMPNAVAYGTGLPFFRAIAVTEALLELLPDDNQLEAVIAHEIGHIRSKDVGVMTFVGILFQMLEKATNVFLRGGSVFGKGPFGLIFGYIFRFLSKYVFSIMRFAVSKEREYAADALAAETQGTTVHMIAALRLLHASRKKQGEFDFGDDTKIQIKDRDPIEDLMVSHPGLSERIESLENIATA